MDSVKIHRSIAKLKGAEIFHFDTQTDKPVILCLHGRWGRAETWYDFIQHYGRKFRIIAPDQRGHGLSSKPVSRYTADEMAGDMVELLDYLGVAAVILVGHSMGGRVAGYFAAKHPDRVKALALLDKSAAGPAKPCTLPPDRITAADPVTKDWPMPFSSIYEAMSHIRQASESDLSCQYFMNSLVETVEGYQMMFSTQAMTANIAYEEVWFNLLTKIKCPVLLLRAKGSGAVPDEDFHRMKSMIANCMAREISTTDHNVHLADKEKFYKYFDEFLAWSGLAQPLEP